MKILDGGTPHISLSPCSWVYHLDCARSWAASPPYVDEPAFIKSSASHTPEFSSIAATVHAAMSRFFLCSERGWRRDICARILCPWHGAEYKRGELYMHTHTHPPTHRVFWRFNNWLTAGAARAARAQLEPESVRVGAGGRQSKCVRGKAGLGGWLVREVRVQCSGFRIIYQQAGSTLWKIGFRVAWRPSTPNMHEIQKNHDRSAGNSQKNCLPEVSRSHGYLHFHARFAKAIGHSWGVNAPNSRSIYNYTCMHYYG